MTAAGGRSSREKGARAERRLVDYLRELGLDAHRTASGYHQDGGDIYWPASPFVVDVKHQERVRLPEWWRELVTEADELGRDPVLVLRRPNAPDPRTWLAVEAGLGDTLPAGHRPRYVDAAKVRVWHEWNLAEADPDLGNYRPALVMGTQEGFVTATTVYSWITTYLQTREGTEWQNTTPS